MARIRDAKGREQADSGYVRLFGHEDLGMLLSRVHATLIRNGNELEELIKTRCPFHRSGLQQRVMHTGQLLAFDEAIEVYFGEQINLGQGRPISSDAVILNHTDRTAVVVEIKDGDAFDTKKAQGEHDSMSRIAKWLGEMLQYSVKIYFCCFNQKDKHTILNGLKGRFSIEEVLTGREFCEMIAVDYDELCRAREADARDNLEYFTKQIKDCLDI